MNITNRPKKYSVLFSNNTKLITYISPNLIEKFIENKAILMNTKVVKVTII